MSELAVIDVAPQLLTKGEARKLDDQVRRASDRAATDVDKLLGLLQRAAAGQIHEALGLSSWTAWFKDAVQIQVSDRFERKSLVSLMSGSGMSQRAIAGTLGVAQMTVSRDLGETNGSPEGDITGTDNKTYKRKAKAEEVEDIEDAEEVDLPEEEAYKATAAADLVVEFDDEAHNLYNAVSAILDITNEEKWPSARKRVAKAHLTNLGEWINDLQGVVDALMEA